MDTLKSITLDQRLLCELELITNGGFLPLTGFMTEKQYYRVLNDLQLDDTHFFPLPVNLYITEKQYLELKDEKKIVLKDEQGFSLAVVHVEDFYQPDYDMECLKAYKTLDENHTYVKIVMERKRQNMWYVGGVVEKIQDVCHYDFCELRHTPAQLKQILANKGWNNVVFFQTRNVMHRSHYELTLSALKQAGENAKLVLHPCVGITQESDTEYHIRVQCYKEMLKYYPKDTVILSLLPLSMRFGSGREALLHALIRQNYGATSFIVGRDHAGVSSKDKNGNAFNDPYEAQKLALKYEEKLGLKIITSDNIAYVKELDKYLPESEVPEGMTVLNISGTKQRQMLIDKTLMPDWFTFPDVYKILQQEFNAPRKGVCFSMTGLSGCGKSAVSLALVERLRDVCPERKVTVLDGDVVRMHLSKGLGFTDGDRSTNCRRIGFVASEVVKHSGLVITANINPFEKDRQFNRELISVHGTYVEVYVDTSLKTCEKRDCKGLYDGARKGTVKLFTGISSPYDVPVNPEIVLKETNSVGENVDVIVNYCVKNGLL